MPAPAEQPRIAVMSNSDPRSVTATDPRQPNRFEKKKNIEPRLQG
jgi:hypothetical protein